MCYKCGQTRHYIRDYPQRVVHPSIPLASQSMVQMERPREVDPSPAQSFRGKASARVFFLNPQEVYESDIDLPGMFPY